MRNPWADLPETPPYVAPADAPSIRRHAEAAARLQLDFLPAPYLGRPDARVYVLMLNPRGRHDDCKYGADFVQERRRALRFESPRCFWSLDPAVRGSEAYEYATRRMRVLIDAVGQQRVAERMMWVQYFGYQSVRWRPFPVVLPSQRFGFELARAALAAGKLVIHARGPGRAAVPQLASYDHIKLRAPLSPYLTPKNMGVRAAGDAAFARVVEALSD